MFKIKFKNKKSLALEALVRIIIAVAVLLLVVFPISNKIYAAFFSSERRYLQSFEEFVDNINELNKPRETFTLNLKKESAIIGFSKNSDKFSVNFEDMLVVVANKPKSAVCSGNACICLCAENFKLKSGESKGKPVKTAICEKLTCKEVDKDIVDNVPVRYAPSSVFTKSTTTFWRNGFLFGAEISELEDLKSLKPGLNSFIVEKDKSVIGICSYDMIEFNKRELGSDKCIVKDFEDEIGEAHIIKRIEKLVCSKSGKPEKCSLNAFTLSKIAEEKFLNTNLVLALAWQESKFEHCKTNSLICGTFNQNNVNCNTAQSCGIMQINKKAHPDLFAPTDRYDCQGQTAYDTECNIKIGIGLLQDNYKGYAFNDNLYKSTAEKFCKNPDYAEKYLSYNGWDRAFRAYNGFGCTPPPEGNADVHYVENVNEKLNLLTRG